VVSAVAVRTTIQVLMGLSDLHQQGFVHRDLGFENVMVTGADPETAMLIDFGRCATVKGGMTEHGGGVWELMPAAQWDKRATPTTDVQTAAAMLALLILGRAPFYPGDDLYAAGNWDAYETACRKLAYDAEVPDRVAVAVEERAGERAGCGRDAGSDFKGAPWKLHDGRSVLRGPSQTIGGHGGLGGRG
jgi:serine/threonine protein kinase